MGLDPNSSAAHRIVHEALVEGGLELHKVRELLWLLNASPDLSDFDRVLENLLEVLKAAEAEWPSILEFQGLDWIVERSEALLSSIEKVMPALRKHTVDIGQARVTRNALYYALGKSLSRTQPLRGRYRLLHAHFFFAHRAVLLRFKGLAKDATTIENYEAYGGVEEWPALKMATPYRAGLCIREMAEQRNSDWASECLEKLGVTLSPRELPLHAHLEMVSKRSRFNVQKKVNYLSEFLRQAYGITEKSIGRGSSPGRRQHSEIGDPDDPALYFGILTDWEIEPETEDDDGSDDCPGEDESEGFGGNLDCEDAGYAASPGSFAGRVTGAIHQLIRQQKMFRFGVERLCPRELIGFEEAGRERVYTLFHHVREGYSGPSAFRRRAECSELSNFEEAETTLFLMVMLWTGSSAERTAHLKFAIREDCIPGEEFVLILDRWDRSKVSFRIRAPFPSYRTHQAPVPESDCNRTEYVYLPDAAGLGGLLHSHSHLLKLRGDWGVQFNRSIDEWNKRSRTLLRAWDPTGRLTLAKISSALFAEIMSRTGNDAVAATMITGLRHRLSKVPMYYSCRRLETIQKVYMRAVDSLRKKVAEEEDQVFHFYGRSALKGQPAEDASSIPITAPMRDWNEETSCIGRRLCPRPEKVKEMVQRLKDSLRKPYRNSSDGDWIRYHNDYTFYTVLAFALATGVRKMRTPYVGIERVSPLTRVAMIRDKDGDSGTKAKLVWIPKSVYEQMGHYATHLAFSRSRFGIARDDLPCFFLTEHGGDRKSSAIEIVRPATIRQHLDLFLPGYPPDIHRRFMFNVLLECGCPPEVARVWMGHACVGEEWWSDNATLSHSSYRRQLEKYLVPVLDELGIKSIKGASADKNNEFNGGANE